MSDDYQCQCPYCVTVNAGGEVILNSTGGRLHICHYDNCGQVFDYTSYLVYHLKKCHGESSLYECQIEGCDKKFTRPSSLKIHEISHNRELKYVCDSCSFRSSRKDKLAQHVTIHKNIKQSSSHSKKCRCPFCKLVEQGGKRNVDFITGRRVHVCHFETCGKIFNRVSILAQHLKKHAEENLYRCEYCKASFSQKKNLILHTSLHTGILPSVSDIQDEFCSGDDLNIHMLNLDGDKKQIKKSNSREKKVERISVKSVNLVKDLVSVPGTNRIKLVLCSDESQVEETECEPVDQEQHSEEQQIQISFGELRKYQFQNPELGFRKI